MTTEKTQPSRSDTKDIKATCLRLAKVEVSCGPTGRSLGRLQREVLQFSVIAKSTACPRA